jgi:hypothetical protein
LCRGLLNVDTEEVDTEESVNSQDPVMVHAGIPAMVEDDRTALS